MQIFKGQEILPDDSTLAQHDISNGDRVNIMLEVDQNISMEVNCGPKSFTYEISLSTRVNELKKMLIDSKQVAFPPSEFDLVKYEMVNGVEQEKILGDEALPLHYYGIENDTVLHALNHYIIIKVVNPKGRVTYEKFHKTTTVRGMKKIIDHYLCDQFVTDISMFVPSGINTYTKLDTSGDATISLLFPTNKTIYFIEDRSFQLSWPVYYNQTEYGRIYISGHGMGTLDTVRSIKLRIQDEFGIPYNCTNVFEASPICEGICFQYIGASENPYGPNIRRTNLNDDDFMRGFIEIV